ncbi:MAG: hypothetical protein ACO2O2_03790 [Acidilobaceae archaeon]
MGECLAVSAALDYEGLGIPGIVRDAVLDFYTTGDTRALGGLSLEDRVLAYTIAYGGLMLIHICDPVTPISRAHVRVGIEIVGVREPPGRVDDRRMLRSWALIYSGLEEEGLRLLQGVSYYPVNLEWRPGGRVRVLPVAVTLTL